MRPGTKPKPPELKILNGDRKSRINQDAPRAIMQREAPPEYFDEYAREEWFDVCDDLASLGVLSRTDRGTLILYCSTFSEWRKADEKMKENPSRTIPNGQGTPKADPLIAIVSQSRLFCFRILCELGLTPAARNRVSARATDTKGSIRDFLKDKAKA
jgi:P27 family predicted phage terminase small subunit